VTDLVAVDSSALVAVIGNEAEQAVFSSILARSRTVVGWPTILEMRIWCQMRLEGGRSAYLERLLDQPSCVMAPFDGDLEAWSASAFARFGKGRHPAKLNFGDCMSYAVARHFDVPLLFKGADFGKTDLKIHPDSVLL
jgi:ribonuclease VapC